MAINGALDAVRRSQSFLKGFDLEYYFPNGEHIRKEADPEFLGKLLGLTNNITASVKQYRNFKG